jgi:RHS repeat-associated protein
VASEETQNAKGVRVRMQRMYYDGAPFAGLPLGQVARGDITRTEAWLGGDGFEQVASSSFDADGNPLEVRDGRGGAHLFSWDPSDRHSMLSESVKTETGLLTEQATYDGAFGGLLSATAYNGQTSTITYDPFGRVAAVVRPGDSGDKPTVRYSYEQGSPLSRVKTEKRLWNGHDDVETSMDYVDGLGRRRASVEPFGQKFVVANISLFDAQGNGRRALRARFLDSGDVTPALLQNGDVPGWDSWRDPVGRVVRTRSQMGIETRAAFAPFVSKSWDGAQADAASPYEHTPTVKIADGLGRVISVASTLGGKPYAQTFVYDAAGALLQKTDPEGNVSRYGHDGRGRRVLVDDPDSGKHAFTYDPAGNVIEHRSPDGVSRRFSYDLAGRMVTDDHNGDGTPEVTHAWDPSTGVLTRSTEPSGFTEYEYDDRLRITKTRYGIKDGTYEIGAAYDAQDREYWHQYPDGSSVRMFRDERGLINAYGSAVALGFDADGVLVQKTFSTGVVEEHGYDDDRRSSVARVRTAAGTILQELHWSYDAASNITGVKDARPGVTPDKDRSEDYTHDNLYRLTATKGAWGTSAWTYSPSGNLLTRTSTVDALRAGAMGYGEKAGPHALTSVGSRKITYDLRGRMLSDGARTYTWNDAEQLVKVSHENGASSESLFDGAGMRRVRVERAADGSIHETRFLDPSTEVQDGKLVRWIVHGGHRLARLADDNGIPGPSKGGGCSNAPNARTSDAVLVAAVIGFACVVAARRRRFAASLLACAAVGISIGCSGGTHENVQEILDGTIHTLTDADELLFTDALGSLTEVTSGTGTTAKGSFATYPYGVTRYDSTTETNKYSGAPRDAQVGVDLMGARGYIPELGVWSSVDPLRIEEPERGLRAGFAQEHAYAYARLAPTNAVDGSGRDPSTAERWLKGASTVISSTTKVVDFVSSPIAGPSKDLAEVLVNAGTAVARGNGADYAKQFVLNGNIPGEIASHTMPSLMPQTKDGEQARMDKRVVAIQIVGAFLPGPKPGKAVVKEVPSAVKTIAEGVEHCVGGACCFAAGTLIATEAGERPIEDIAIGDRVLSRDPDTGETSMREVVWLKPPLVTGIVRVTVRDEDGHEEDIRTTTEHVFWTENHGWIRVAELTPGDGLVSASGHHLSVGAVQQTVDQERVYNFAVDGTHTYFVAHAQVWVHNEGPCGTALMKAYGGPGGGHHVFAKKAFEGAVGYDAKTALAIPNAELAKLGVSHPVVTGAQASGYKAFAKTAQKLTWEAAAEIETNALVKGGMDPDMATKTVNKAMGALKASGVEGPVKIPWGG